MKNKRNSTILWNIKELYEWAAERGVEEYTLFKFEVDGKVSNCSIFDIDIDDYEEALIL